jgi:hypothetical protein
MKLNTLKLPHAVISALYGKSLVTIENDDVKTDTPAKKTSTAKTDTATVNAPQIEFLGENKKKILVLVNYGNVRYLPDEELAFLTNMLTACKLNIADVAIVNLNKIADPSYKELFGKLGGNIILLFGADPSVLNLPMSFPLFQVQSFNSYTFLFTPSLGEISNDKILKSKLWVCLRRIFNV